MSFQLPNQTSFAQARPTYTGTTWSRPSDWITITDAPGVVQFLVSDVVYPVYNIETNFTRPGAENIYIDWGDGSPIDTISSTSQQTRHFYTSGGTPCSRGYNTWKITISGDVGTQITSCKFFDDTTYYGGLTATYGVLEAYYGDNTIVDTNTYFQSTGTRRFTYLEYCKLPATMNGSGTILVGTFNGCIRLGKVDMPTSAPNANNIQIMFQGCRSLTEVILPQDMTQITDFTQTFTNCNKLNKIVFPSNLNLVTTLSGAFQNCFSLSSIQLPQTNSATNFTSTFSGCLSLLDLEIKSWSLSTATYSLGSIFQNCYSLESVKIPTTMTAGSTTTFTSAFDGCRALKVFTQFPTNFNTTSLDTTFRNCQSLSKVSFPSSISGLASMNNTFESCFALPEVVLPTTIASTIQMGSTFNSCTSLSEILVPSTYNHQNLQLFASGCVALKRVELGATYNSGSGFMQNAFNGCTSLVSIVMPTNMTGVANMTGTFQNCTALTGCTLPASMPALTTLNSTFANCNNLTNLTLPTTASNLNNMQLTFFGCNVLSSITLPTTTGLITTYASTFANCFSLKTITLPTTSSTTLTTINSFGVSCNNLTTINNQSSLGNSSTSSTIYIDGTNFMTQGYNLTSLDLVTKFSKFVANASSTTPRGGLTSLRLRNNGAGQYGGTSPQIDIKNNNLGQAALVQVFNDLPTITAKTIDISNNPGASLLTAGERAIATGKGWTITG